MSRDNTPKEYPNSPNKPSWCMWKGYDCFHCPHCNYDVGRCDCEPTVISSYIKEAENE